jgi:hypothetical protein
LHQYHYLHKQMPHVLTKRVLKAQFIS